MTEYLPSPRLPQGSFAIADLQFAIGLETRGQFAILKSPLENRHSKIENQKSPFPIGRS
jgi:uncharacterized membrane protein YcaP (DUF421 family)